MSLPRLRAPAGDGELLAHPPLADLGSRLAGNRALLANNRIQIGGMPLAEVRRSAVGEMAEAARRYLASAGEPVPDLSAESLLVAGHQPDLFHAGVWLKNFALNSLAREHGAAPLNLVVDNDTVKSTAVRLPVVGDHCHPEVVHLASVPYDQFAGEIAFEERTVHDEATFAAFPRAVGERTRNWPFAPILEPFWNDVVRQPTPLLGERFAAARRTWERRWGCQNLELPISHLCRTAAFARFGVGLLADLPEFHATYNDCVRDYRRRHRIRSANHPVPDLHRDGDWLEAPFWAWRVGGQRRGRLFVRAAAGGWRLRINDESWPDLPRATACQRWQQMDGNGYKIRTRALTTTLFARLCLADLFIHGIGGGKYDELTDAIIARHFRLQPPAFLVLTGTLRLPLPGYDADADDERGAWRLVRDIHWNPQRHLPADAEDWQEMAEAREELTRDGGTAWRKQRFRELRRLTDRLRTPVRQMEAAARQRAERVSLEVAANAVLQRRDYAFCLFPESKLRPFVAQFQASRTSEPQALAVVGEDRRCPSGSDC
ncbi:MAG TPA: hypothetical protein VH120_01390 [Gemmataceae bacterium]|nr:hypothetical protein [Gemmataceae bacterium]